MNLEQLTNELHRIANYLANNNDTHWNLNESILTQPPTTPVGDTKQDLGQESGILVSLENAVNKLERLVNHQSYNISRTHDLVRDIVEVPVSCEGVSRY